MHACMHIYILHTYIHTYLLVGNLMQRTYCMYCLVGGLRLVAVSAVGIAYHFLIAEVTANEAKYLKATHCTQGMCRMYCMYQRFSFYYHFFPVSPTVCPFTCR